MQTVLIVVHLLIVLALVGVVLLQRSEGGGLGMGGGGSGVSGFMTGRGQANALTRATAILAALFFITSLGLTVLATVSRGGGSIIDRNLPASTVPATPGAPAGAGGGVLDQLKQMQNQAPAAPATPATPQVPTQR